MKNLNQFNEFHWDKFAEGKCFSVAGVSEWKDFDTKEHQGTKVNVYISSDKTPYKPDKNGFVQTNLGEKLTFKVSKDIGNLTPGMTVVPVGVKATVYGEYRNQLSVRCDDIRPVALRKE